MDNVKAKEILSAYRVNGADAQDPVFRDPLAQCEHDPAMRDWFGDQQAFDARATELFRGIPVPKDGKTALLATLDLDVIPVRKSRRYSFPLALAAGLVFLLSFWAVMRSGDPVISFEPGEFRLASFVKQMSLVHTSDRYEDLVRWLEDQGAPTPQNLPEALRLARGQGCNVYDDGRGGRISFICVNLDGINIHLFVFDDISAELLDQPENTWTTEEGWQTLAWSENGRKQALVVKSVTPELLRFSEHLAQSDAGN